MLPCGVVPVKWETGACKAGSEQHDCKYATEAAAMLAKNSSRLASLPLNKSVIVQVPCCPPLVTESGLLPTLGAELSMSIYSEVCDMCKVNMGQHHVHCAASDMLTPSMYVRHGTAAVCKLCVYNLQVQQQ